MMMMTSDGAKTFPDMAGSHLTMHRTIGILVR